MSECERRLFLHNGGSGEIGETGLRPEGQPLLLHKLRCRGALEQGTTGAARSEQVAGEQTRQQDDRDAAANKHAALAFWQLAALVSISNTANAPCLN